MLKIALALVTCRGVFKHWKVVWPVHWVLEVLQSIATKIFAVAEIAFA